MKKIIVWLDDERNPFTAPHSDYYSKLEYDDVLWFKTFESFENFLKSFDFDQKIVAVFFDHDLCDEDPQKSGYYAAKLLFDFVQDNNIPPFNYASQSANPVGRRKILEVFEDINYYLWQ